MKTKVSNSNRNKFFVKKMIHEIQDFYNLIHSDSSVFESVKDSFDSDSTDSEAEKRTENKLMNAILLNKIDRVKTITETLNEYEKKIKINHRDEHQRTPVFYAIYRNSYEMCDYLFQNHAETLFKDKNHRTILHVACIKGVDKKLV